MDMLDLFFPFLIVHIVFSIIAIRVFRIEQHPQHHFKRSNGSLVGILKIKTKNYPWQTKRRLCKPKNNTNQDFLFTNILCINHTCFDSQLNNGKQLKLPVKKRYHAILRWVWSQTRFNDGFEVKRDFTMDWSQACSNRFGLHNLLIACFSRRKRKAFGIRCAFYCSCIFWQDEHFG